MVATRNTTIRDRHRRAIAKDQPPCSYEHCLYPDTPIDYQAAHLDPLSFTVDHTIPINRGGADELHNKTAMHRACNRAKSDKVDDDHVDAPRVFVTSLTW
jgi:5-methylcytosine-specific restriction endonuclease McrA